MRTSDLSTQMGLMLVLLEEFSIVPELWAFFESAESGTDHGSEFLRFIDTFAGFTISIPDADKMKRTLKMIHVYHIIENAEQQRRGVCEASSFYAAPEEEILRLYRKVKGLVQDHQKRLEEGPGPATRRPFKPQRRTMETARRKKQGMVRKDPLCPNE